MAMQNQQCKLFLPSINMAVRSIAKDGISVLLVIQGSSLVARRACVHDSQWPPARCVGASYSLVYSFN